MGRARGSAAAGADTPVELTWDQLVRLEPRLEAVRAYASGLGRGRGDERFCAQAAWRDDVAVHLRVLVGPARPRGAPRRVGDLAAQLLADLAGRGGGRGAVFGPADAVLRSEQAWQVAATVVWDALPACRG